METRDFFVFLIFLKLAKLILCKNDYMECGLLPGDIGFIVAPQQEAGVWPWMASYGFYADWKWKHQCGATLVSDRHLVTAAHCIRESNSSWKLLTGVSELNANTSERSLLELDVEKAVIHPGYDGSAYFDIGVLRTKEIKLNKDIRPICLPEESSKDPDKYKNHLMTIIGWGSSALMGKPSSLLKRADVKVFPQSYCNEVHQPFLKFANLKEEIPRLFEDQLICAGNILGKEGSCKGDSGGPLLFQETETAVHKYVQVGMVQGSIGECGDKNIPGIYVRLDDPLILNFLNGEKTGFYYKILNYEETCEQGRVRYEGNTKDEIPWGNGTMMYKDESTYEGEWINGSRKGYGILYYSQNELRDRLKYEGSWENNMMSGHGILLWKNGQRFEGEFLNDSIYGKGKMIFGNESDSLSYEGDFVDGEASGKGILIQKNGETYDGDWFNDTKHGTGKIIFSDEDEGLSYEGDWKDDQRSGKGVYIGKDGEEYTGDWLNDLKHGKGKMLFTNKSSGRSYEGDWVKGNFTGEGVYIWRDGQMYDGQWLNDLRHGKGKMIYAEGNFWLSYDGDWLDDAISGEGILLGKDGTRYEGKVLNGLRHGEGNNTFSEENEGLSYVGDWVEDERSGKGIYTEKNGDTYDGEFVSNIFSGRGVYTWADGSQYMGDFKDGIQQGYGTYFYPPESELEKYVGEFENDESNGIGGFYWKNGDKYIGQVKDALFHGYGAKISSNDEILQQGKWEDNELVDERKK